MYGQVVLMMPYASSDRSRHAVLTASLASHSGSSCSRTVIDSSCQHACIGRESRR